MLAYKNASIPYTTALRVVGNPKSPVFPDKDIVPDHDGGRRM
jgi:hypothetical protein